MTAIKNIFRVPAFVIKGAAYGVGAAGAVNTWAPGLFPTMVGYLAAQQPQMLAKASLLGIGIFTPTGISAKIILGVGAVIGVVVYSLLALLVWLVKGLFKDLKK